MEKPHPLSWSTPVAKLMSYESASLPVELTVEKALDYIRHHPPQVSVIYFYCVDKDGRLVGVIPTRSLLMADRHNRLQDIMVSRVVSVTENTTLRQVAKLFTRYRYLGYPVVDSNRRLTGMIDAEAVVRALARDRVDRHRSQDDFFQLIGFHVNEAEGLSSWKWYRIRIPWLLGTIIAGLIAAWITGMFRKDLESAIGLAMFIPVVLSLAESVGMQALSLSVQRLHQLRPSTRQIFEDIREEVGAGVLLAITCASILSLAGGAWLSQPIAVILLGGIGSTMVLATVVGVSVPYLLRQFKLDPKIAAGPFSLALIDLATILIYFSIAHWVLGR